MSSSCTTVIKAFFSSKMEMLNAVSSSVVILGMRTRMRCPKFDTTSSTRVSCGAEYRRSVSLEYDDDVARVTAAFTYSIFDLDKLQRIRSRNHT